MNFDPYFVLQLQTLLSISIYILDESGRTLFPEYVEDENDFVRHDGLNAYLRTACEEVPKIFQRDEMYFGGFSYKGICYIIGPCNIGGLTFREHHKFARKYGKKGNTVSISETSHQVLGDTLALLYYQITGRKILGHEIWREPIVEKGKDYAGISEKEKMKYGMERTVLDEYQHISYAEERAIFDCIRNGKKLSHDMGRKIDELKRVGRMAESGRKGQEYMAVSAVTLSTRAAIEGGVNSGKAYELSDLYLQRLEKCVSQDEMLLLCVEAMNDFSDHVAAIKREKEQITGYVEKCKIYLSQNLHKKANMKELADVIGLNYSYLSRIFSFYAGMTLTEYARKEKLNGAANMLRYSEYSIAEIAEYFCFASVSRFGQFFKKEFGMTPSQYRKRYQVHDYI